VVTGGRVWKYFGFLLYKGGFILYIREELKGLRGFLEKFFIKICRG
jgi:hypothetical protein